MFFEKIYIAEIDKVSSNIADSFIMCGNTNWDHYFEKKDNNTEYEELKNINFIEFEDHNDFLQFIKDNKYIDYSSENNKYSVLYYA